MTGAMGLTVINHGMSISVLSGTNDVQAVYPALRALMIQRYRDIMTRQLAAQCDRSFVVTACRAKLRRRRRHVEGVVAFPLQTIMLELCTIFYNNLNYG